MGRRGGRFVKERVYRTHRQRQRGVASRVGVTFSCYVVFHCVNVPQFLIHSFTDAHLCCFQHLTIVNCAAMNIGVHKFFWIGVSGFLGYNPSSRIAGSKAVPFLVFWGNSMLFSTEAASVCIPTNSALGFLFLHNLSNTCLLICLWWPFWPVWSGISL